MANGLGTSFRACDVRSVCSYFRGLKAEPNILGHALSKVEVLQEKKNIMLNDSKLESSAISVRMFWRVNSREEMSIIIVTAVHGIRPYRGDCLAPPCLFLVQNTKTGAQNMQYLHFNSTSSRKVKRYRGGGRKGDGVRCEGGTEGAGRQQISTDGRQMSRQNHSTNITTTTFLTQHKTKTATTIEISRQYLKIRDNKTRER